LITVPQVTPSPSGASPSAVDSVAGFNPAIVRGDRSVSNSDYPQQPSGMSMTPQSLEFYGFIALLGACLLLLIRMLIDPALVRRPLLTPNLSIGGLSFIGVSLFLFLMANVITSTPLEQRERGPALGPGYALLNMLPELPTTPDALQA